MDGWGFLWKYELCNFFSLLYSLLCDRSLLQYPHRLKNSVKPLKVWNDFIRSAEIRKPVYREELVWLSPHFFTYFCHTWWSERFTNRGSRTSYSDPVRLSPHFFIFLCAAFWYCAGMRAHEQGPDLSCGKHGLTWVLTAYLTMHCRFL